VLTASATTIPQDSEIVLVTYNGDANFAGSNGYSSLINVNIPDFALAPSAGITLTPMAGQPASAQVTITPATGTPSTVQMYLNQAPTISGYSISLSPAQVNLNGSATTATLTMTPTVSISGNVIKATARRSIFPVIPPRDWWTVSLTTGLAALLLLALPGRQKRVRAALGFGLACVLCLVLGCGGGAGGTVGGPPPPPPPPGPTSVTLTTTSAKSPWGQSFTITATVTATKPLTGSIVFYDLGNQISSFGLTHGQAQIGWGYITNLGIHQITASYTGDSNNLASTTSAPLTQIITGTTTVGFFGATGGDFHSIPVTIGVQ